jgi:hypothetical protein
MAKEVAMSEAKLNSKGVKVPISGMTVNALDNKLSEDRAQLKLGQV